MIMRMYRLSHRLYLLGVPVLPRVLSIAVRIIFSAHVPAQCTIGRGSIIAYGGAGLVIHPRAIIGDSCVLSPGVVIGGRGGAMAVPIIGDGVSIFPGAKILGPISIGRGATVGANAVVTDDVAEGERVVAPKSRFLDR